MVGSGLVDYDGNPADSGGDGYGFEIHDPDAGVGYQNPEDHLDDGSFESYLYFSDSAEIAYECTAYIVKYIEYGYPFQILNSGA